jgi:hypothetical protein
MSPQPWPVYNSHTAPPHPNGVRPAVPIARGAGQYCQPQLIAANAYEAAVRYGLVSLGCLLVVFSLIRLVQLPRPPG